MPHLLALPPELLNSVVDNLDHPRDVASLVGTSYTLSILLTPHLHNLALSPCRGLPALHLAAIGNHIPLAQLALVHGHDVNARSRSHHTPLHLAAFHGHYNMLLFLLANGANVNAHDRDSLTPLHSAVTGRRIPAIKVLVANGADVNAAGRFSKKPLQLAFSNWRPGDTPMMRLLLDLGADIPTFNPWLTGETYAQYEMLQLLKRETRNANGREAVWTDVEPWPPDEADPNDEVWPPDGEIEWSLDDQPDSSDDWTAIPLEVVEAQEADH